jgi:histidine ammonia-lyase
MKKTTPEVVMFGHDHISIEKIVALGKKTAEAELSSSPEFREKLQKSVDFLNALLKEDGVVYGVTTGYGDSCTIAVPAELVPELPMHLTRFHGCGMGDNFSPSQSRAIMATSLSFLSRGLSGVRPAILERLISLLNQDIAPRIPQEGSVGASGDLTPLSYVAAVIAGEREVFWGGQLLKTSDVYQKVGLDAIALRPKEGLALMNGTAAMTALSCLAFDRAEYLMRLATRITAMVVAAMQGNSFHFNERLFAAKPHPGQQKIAAWLRDDLGSEKLPRNSHRLQDRYSLRCAPHVIGVMGDSLAWWRQMIENELNSATDNPLIDGENETVMHGGHFYGGHIAMVMDSMKIAVANVADLLDRQLAQLVDPKFNNGLPANLSGSTPERSMINHGFKAVQIAVSSWTAEALKLTMPASVFSRSTECHNQDKVSMGTIAARDCLRILTLTEQVAAACLLTSCQALELRRRDDEMTSPHISTELEAMWRDCQAAFAFLDEDRPLETELRQFLSLIQEKRWELYND